MATRDLHNNLAVVHLLDAQDIVATDTYSAILDTNGFESAELLVNLGAATPLSGSVYLTPILQESDTVVGTDFTTVAAGSVLGAFTVIDAASEDSCTQHVGYIGYKRYVRVKLDVTGSLSATNVAVTGLLGHAARRPVTAPAAVSAT